MENPLKKGYTQAGWIPACAGRTDEDACAESTPRIRKKCSGGKDGEGRYEKDMTLAATYSSNGLPHEYHRRVGLNFRVRDGNGCFPDAMTTRVMSQMKTK